jgi:hypothetical protein
MGTWTPDPSFHSSPRAMREICPNGLIPEVLLERAQNMTCAPARGVTLDVRCNGANTC